MPVLEVFAGDGLAIIEDLYGLPRVEACMPPVVPKPKRGPCPGAKSAAKKAADTVKDAAPKKAVPKKTAKPKAADTVKDTAAPKKAAPKKTAAPKAAPAAVPTAGPGTGRDLLADPSVDLNPILSLWRFRPDVGDERLVELSKLQGFDAVPQVGTGREVDDAIRAGGIELFRGAEASEDMSSAQMHEAFRSGPIFYGYGGRKGNGIYATVGRDDATSYSDGKRGSVMRMALKPGARVVTPYELHLMIQKEIPEEFEVLEAKLQAAEREWAAPKTTSAQVDAARQAMKAAQAAFDASAGRIFRDKSAYAMAKGFDAVRIPGGTTGRDDNYILLNRAAVLAEEARR